MSKMPLLFAVAALSAAPAFAQVPMLPPAAEPGAVQQRQIDEQQRRRDEELQRRGTEAVPLIAPAPPPAAEAPASAVRFAVRQIVFSKSEILAAATLDALAKEYVGREVAMGELKTLVDRVNAFYRQKGVATAQAVLPPQDVTDGVVHIRLVEGRLGKIDVSGNASTNADFVSARIGLKPSDLLDLGQLEGALIRFNRTNDAQLQAELGAGEKFATTDLHLTVAEPVYQELRLTLDNLGAEATGYERAGIAYENRSVFGYRDDVLLSYTSAVGQESRSAAYAFPFNIWGGRMSLGYYDDRTAIKHGPLSSLGITGVSTADIASLRQPAYVTTLAELDVVGGWKRQRSANQIGTFELSKIAVIDHNLGLEARYFGHNSSWFGSYARTIGNAEVSGHERLAIDRGAVRHSRELGGGLSLVANVNWQTTPHVLLPSGEQIFIGGEGSVRGYPIGTYAGDEGQVLNLEMHHPLAAASRGTFGFGATGFVFIDYGRVKPFRPPGSGLGDYDHLGGIGWGALAELAKHFDARLTLPTGPDRVPAQSHHYDTTLQLVSTVF